MPAPQSPILCLVVDRSATRHALAPAVEAAFAAGVDWLQIRDRELEAAPLLDLTRELGLAAARGAAQRGHGATVLVNRRIDVALALRAEWRQSEEPEERDLAIGAHPGIGVQPEIGVHLGFDAVTVEDARALLGAEASIGVSAHTAAEVGEAARAGASYAHLAPIFAPLSKRSERPPLGTDALAEARAFGIPVLAQGGIEPRECAAVLGAGAAGVAVTGAILQAADPAAAARALRAALDARAPDQPRSI